jgi:hypothetical protein
MTDRPLDVEYSLRRAQILARDATDILNTITAAGAGSSPIDEAIHALLDARLYINDAREDWDGYNRP